MARVCGLYVITCPAVVPEQPASLGSDSSGCSGELRRVRAEQQIAASGHAAQCRFQRARVAPVVLQDKVSGAVKQSPDLQRPSSLGAELSIPARQRKARANAQQPFASHYLTPSASVIDTSYRNS
jgi:hypothetical protein